MKLKLLTKFVLSLSILGAALTVAISFFSYGNSKTYLEDMYAQRVTSGSKSVATMIAAADVKAILADGGDQSEAYVKTKALLNALKQDGEITYLSLVVPDEDSVTFYIDASVEAMGDDPADMLAYGSNILYADAAQDTKDLHNYEVIWDLYVQNKGTDTPLITDNSYGYNYTSVSPVLDEDGKAIAEIQYILDMQEVREHLNSFLYKMLLIALGIVALALICYVLFVRKVVTVPIGKLAAFTKSITDSGNFKNQRIDIKTNDEIEDLGHSFNYMMAELENYIDNLSHITAEKERIGAELNVATRIQASMLPCIFPAFPERKEFDIYASMLPAKEVGGDFYDFFLIDDNKLAVVIADVSGKGVPAALFMVIAKTLIKNNAQYGKSPKEVFETVNDMLCENNEAGMFVTAFMGILDISSGTFSYVNAGHNPPLLKRADGDYGWLPTKPGFVLAGMEGISYKQDEITLNRGDSLYMYTDGVTEAVNRQDDLFTEPKLLEVANKNKLVGLKDFCVSIKTEIDLFANGAEQADDITMLIIKNTGGAQ